MSGRSTTSTVVAAVALATAAAAIWTTASAATLTRVVQTRYGKLQGVVRTVDATAAGGGGGSAGRTPGAVDTFLGVPYATPPVGSNRFGPTRTPSPWDGVRLADAPGPVCPQRLPDVSNETAALQRMPVGRLVYLKRLLPYLRNQSEDCLYLNIYAPSQGHACVITRSALLRNAFVSNSRPVRLGRPQSCFNRFRQHLASSCRRKPAAPSLSDPRSITRPSRSKKMTHALSDEIKCLENVSYDVVKHNAHFEWVSGFESTIKRLTADVFETIGVADENALSAALKGLDEFQGNLKTKMDELVEQVVGKSGLKEGAKKFVVEWADACKYQIDLKYHLMGGGPDAQKVRWSYESAIKYIIICATHLADKDDDVEFKKQVSDFVKDIIIQSLIDVLENLKSQLSAPEKSS